MRYFQLLSLFLPTSLFVSVEFLKVFIAYFIYTDWRLMSKEKAKGTSVRNMSIIEDLGMVHYIFSDKTGTLTRNQMDFHSMCVGSEVYGRLCSTARDENGNVLTSEFDYEKLKSIVSGKEQDGQVL